jgi:hypothetical protein
MYNSSLKEQVKKQGKSVGLEVKLPGKCNENFGR